MTTQTQTMPAAKTIDAEREFQTGQVFNCCSNIELSDRFEVSRVERAFRFADFFTDELFEISVMKDYWSLIFCLGACVATTDH